MSSNLVSSSNINDEAFGHAAKSLQVLLAGETAQDITCKASLYYLSSTATSPGVCWQPFIQWSSFVSSPVHRGCWARFCCPPTRLQFGLSIPAPDLRTTGGPKKLWSFHDHDSNTMVVNANTLRRCSKLSGKSLLVAKVRNRFRLLSGNSVSHRGDAEQLEYIRGKTRKLSLHWM